MIVREMSYEECIDLLSSSRIGHLACARQGQPYIIPISYVFHGGRMYGFSGGGQKTDWMRENPLVCVQTERITSAREWTSVVVFGEYEELRSTADYEADRKLAMRLFERSPPWWELRPEKNGSDDGTRTLEPIWYMIHVRRVTGHCTHDQIAPTLSRNGDANPTGWLDQFLSRQ